MPLKEVWQGKTALGGDVEVFDLFGHPQKVVTRFVWAAKGSEIVCVLDIPPVTKPEKAVQASIVAKVREQSRN